MKPSTSLINHRWLSALCLAALCLSVSLHGHAGSPASMVDSVHALEAVEVTASRRPLSTVQKLEGTALQSLSSTSIADALKYFSGVQIKDYGGLGGLKTINVRSLGAEHVGVFIDGIRLTNAQNGTVDLGKYSLSTLESVSLHNSNRLERLQSPSEYASGATVYLTTRRPSSDSLSVSASIGSFHTYGARFNVETDRRGWQGFLGAEYVSSRGDYPFRYVSEYEDTVGIRANSDIEFLRVESAIFHKGFTSRLYAYFSERGCPGGIVRRLSDKYTNIGREWDKDIFGQISWQLRPGHIHFLKFNAKYSFEYLRYNTDYPENQNTARVDNHYRQNDAYASAVYYVRPAAWFNVNVGYDARLSWLAADLRNFSTVRRLDQKAVVSAEIDRGGWRAAASVLYQHYRDHTRIKAGAVEPLSRFTPAITVAYEWSNLIVRTWYKSIFRVPTLNELYYTQAGNRNLQPETTRQWNLGAEYHYNRSEWSVGVQADAYINNVDNRIVCLPLRGTYTWTMLNYGRTFCRGLNATFRGQFSPGDWMLSAVATLTLQRDLNRSDPGDQETYNRPICYSPTFSGALTLSAAWRRFSLTVSELHVSSRMWSYADPEDMLSPYDNVDLKISGGWKMLTVSLEVNDLFDVQYEHIPRYPMPGRSFRFTLAVNL